MQKDDPFGLYDDADRTIISRPQPGGRRTPGARPTPAGPAPQAGLAPMDVGESTSDNPLIRAARPILTLAPHLRLPRPPGDPEQLRQQIARALAKFQDDAFREGGDRDAVKIGAWAMAALIDDIVLNTPWGAQSTWSTRSLVGTEFQQVNAGEQFFERLAEFQRDAGHWSHLLELMYYCLALGFEGRYRLQVRQPISLQDVKDQLYGIISRSQGQTETEISPHWRGVESEHRALGRRIPIWVIGAATLGILALMFTGFSYRLAGYADRLGTWLAALPPQTMPVIERANAQPSIVPAARELAPLLPRINEFLKPEIDEGLVATFEDPQKVLIRLQNLGLFGSGSAKVTDSFEPVLQRIAEAINDEPGGVVVIGHSDNVPIRTPRFPSNWELSEARARAVALGMMPYISDPTRFGVQGRADTEPLASNDTAEGRAANRRIEIFLQK